MTTFLQTGFAVVSTQAGFDALMAAIDAQIVAMGWLRGTDTGQVADLSVAALPAVNTSAGYKIYKTNDILTQLFMRVNYLRGANTEPRLQIQVGYGTDGAGTITGQKSAQVDIHPSETGAPQQLAISGTPSRLSICWAFDATGATTQQMAFGFERDKDVNGADTDIGFCIYTAGAQAGQQFVPKTGTIPPLETSLIAPHPSSTSTAVIGANTLVSAPMPIKETGGGNPGQAVCIYTNNNFSNNTIANVTRYGTSISYLIGIANSGLQAANAAFRTMWRFE